MSHADSIPELASRIKEVRVPCVPLGELLEEHDIKALDLLHIDTEGFDYEILKQVDLAAESAPNFILYEHKHLGDADRAAAERMLLDAGYAIRPLIHDTFARWVDRSTRTG